MVLTLTCLVSSLALNSIALFVITSKSSLDAELDSVNDVLNYGKESIQTSEPIYTIFTMLAMVQALPYDILDTRWFPYEHQGKVGEARFLWSDSSMVWSGKDSIMCDHYRMDIGNPCAG